MKLGDTKFFNLFALIAAATNADRTCDRWNVDDVAWARERSSHKGPDYAFQIEVHTLTQGGRRGWTLMLGHETWWDGEKPDAFRNSKWTHVAKGERAAILKWFAKREDELERP